MSKYVIKIIGRVDNQPTPFDGAFVTKYDPTYCPEGKPYDGGLLEVSNNRIEAKTFDNPSNAMAYWKQRHGTRADGKPNRPLTAFTVIVEPI